MHRATIGAMPRRFERHKRTKAGGYETPPPRSAERAAAAVEPEKRTPGRKNTRAWCRGKVGREHVPVVACRPPALTSLACRWQPRYSDDGVYWWCHHLEECSACGKVLRSGQKFGDSECPGYPGDDGQRQEALREVAASAERWSAWYRRIHPPVTGPQGYRKRRAS